jgi:hypothetical protein
MFLILRGASAIEALGLLGDDALKTQLSRMLEEQGAVTVGMIAELDR